MSDLGRYCCFLCPEGDYSLRRLDDRCQTCGNAFGFPLTAIPTQIGDFDVERPLGRGFYAATFVARRRGPLRSVRVLKVTPVGVYEHFKKNFEEETARHAAVAEHAEHVVEVLGMFDADVDFGGTTIRCHVAELQFIDGQPLDDFLSGKLPLSAAEAAQIAADLFRMKGEFERVLANHNDLHADNIIIERLSGSGQRHDAIEPALKAVAIDLGSVSEIRRSGGDYMGDLHWIARHIHLLAERLLADGDATGDLENRVALKLGSIAQSIAPVTENLRTPDPEDFVREIRDTYYRTAETWRPWRSPLLLKTFKDSYNAQTLDAWYVPQLLVDPDGSWVARISAPGPLVVTGMRGCGKTMLLRSLQFHARAARRPDETDEAAFDRLKQDRYVGLLVSAQRLLNVPVTREPSTSEAFARLFVAYAAEAAKALAHLQDLEHGQVDPEGAKRIAQAVRDALAPAPALDDPLTIEHLERKLSALLIRVGRIDNIHALAAHPSTAFPDLAAAIRSASPLWRNSQILFLLDDVSTRYLPGKRIEELLSALIFQNPDCAFKLTSEAQTIYLSLKSPGQLNPAAHWRDFDEFDLGAQVYDRLRRADGKKFIRDILALRARLHSSHPKASPATVLGDVPLETIAERIAKTQPKSRDRKRVYRGLSALAGMCVGDIGSVITLYEEILAKTSKSFPVDDLAQNGAFQDFCSRHLYNLDSKGGDLKTVATGFAEAAYELLMQSGKDQPTGRLRQYTSIYVRVTSGDRGRQTERLRELVDAGVFVFTGGAPRTKTHDSNPVQQFKLNFRKIYGIVNFIGLSERDRFELSGAELEQWLMDPKNGKEILLRNKMKDATSESVLPEETVREAETRPVEDAEPRMLERTAPESLQLVLPNSEGSGALATGEEATAPIELIMPTIRRVDATKLGKEGIDTLILGLGFEDRAVTSAHRLLDAAKPKRVIAVRYPAAGHANEILDAIMTRGIPVEEIAYVDLEASSNVGLPAASMIDVTGLAKPALFKLVRAALKSKGRVHVSTTAADRYYPLEADLAAIMSAYEQYNHHELLSSLKEVLTGEAGPYRLVPLLSLDADSSRLRGLCAFSSPKHQRLLHVIEERDHDVVEILVDRADTSRAKVAEIAAQVALETSRGGQRASCDASDPADVLDALARRYREWYVKDGLNFEIALTGNKVQSIASAIMSAAFPINEVWYVGPSRFDENRFTQGSRATACWTVELGKPAGT